MDIEDLLEVALHQSNRHNKVTTDIEVALFDRFPELIICDKIRHLHPHGVYIIKSHTRKSLAIADAKSLHAVLPTPLKYRFIRALQQRNHPCDLVYINDAYWHQFVVAFNEHNFACFKRWISEFDACVSTAPEKVTVSFKRARNKRINAA